MIIDRNCRIPNFKLNSYISYSTVWSVESSSGFNHPQFMNAACFSSGMSAQYKLKGKSRYHIHMFKEVLVNKASIVLILKDQLWDHISSLNDLLLEPVLSDLTIEESEYDFEFLGKIKHIPTYLVSFTIDTEVNLIHRFCLSWIRYAYEYPNNILLLDLPRLKNVLGDDSILLFNLFLILGYHYPMESIGHSIIADRRVKHLVTRDYLWEKLNSETRLYNIIPVEPFSPSKISISDQIPLSVWDTDEEFEKNRLPIIKNGYEILIKASEI